jgi:O-antigen/teichoic acid export membrane protein
MTAEAPGLRRWVSSLPRFLFGAISDSLVRNSLYLMTSTAVTAGLGYVFWALAAHMLTRAQVGVGSAVISLCSTAALLTYLGSSATLIDRLPANEHSPMWTVIVVRICAATALVTAVATAAAVVVLLASREYREFFSSAVPVLVAVVGAAALTLVSLFCATFIAARRAGRYLAIQALVSVAKVLLIVPLVAIGAGAAALVGAWVAATLLGVVTGAGWLVPRMGLGRQPADRLLRPAPRKDDDAGPPPGEAPQEAPVGSMRLLIGQHLTSAGGALTPLVLPVLVLIRLGAVSNAYFYITWMVGAIFFTVSPSVSTVLFAEGVRARSDLRRSVAKSLRVITVILAPAIIVMVAAGHFILRLFGAPYAAAGYPLLILLAISAVPDAVSNVAVSVLRVTHRLGYSSLLNIAILVTSLSGAWILMPVLGITGVGVAWLAAQTLGAIASLPAFWRGGGPVS